jgi:autotransporter-associated beta strand protein
VIDSGGILVTANIGTYPATITGGTSLSSGNGTDLIIHQWDNNAAGTLTIATPIVDNGGSIGLTKSGDGTLILTAANTYSGNTYVNNGTLQIGNGGATGSLDNTPAIIIGYGENTAVSAATIGTVAFNRSGTVNLSSSISGSGGLQQVNSGTLVVTANQTYSGPTIISAGTLQIGNGGTSGSISNSISVTNNGSLIFNRSDTVGYAGAINGTGPLTQSGSGNVVLSGVNTYSGNTVVSSGTLSLVGTTNPIAFSAAITVSSGATLDVSGVSYFALNGAAPAFQSLSGSGVVRGNFSVTNGSSVYPATSGVYGNIVFTNGLSLNGGTLYMDVSSSSSDSISVGGNLALNSGLVALNVSGALANGTYPLIRYGGALSGSVTNIALSGFSSATLQTASLSSSTSGEIDLVINSPGAALIWVGNSSANVWDINTTTNWLNGLVLSVFTNGCLATFDDTGLYSSPVAIKTVVSPSLMTVTTANTYILRDNSGTGADYISGSGALIKNGAGTLILEAPNANTGGTVINAGTLQVGGDSLTGDLGSGTITNKGTLVFQQTDNRTVSGAINGSGSLIQQGSATLTLANNNSYTGPTTISSGALQIGQGGALGTLGTGNVTNNAALIFNRSSSYTYSGIISGTGGLTNNAGTLVLAGANTYTGGTIITNGTIKLGNSSALGNSNNVMGIASATATLDLNGHNCTVGSIPGSAGTIINNGSSGTNFITILTSSTFDGLIADGTASLGILVGGGTFQMDGVVNTYSGGTILASGTTLAIAATGGTGGVSAVPGTGGIVASNGATISMPTALGTSVQFGNNITTVDGASVTFTSGELANGIGGNFVGSATATNVMGLGSGLSLGAGSTEQFTNFFGVVLIPSGATLRFSSTGLTLNGGDYTTFDLEGTGVLQTRNAGTVHLGSLIGTGSITEPQANSGFGNFVVGYKNVDCVFGGTITASNSLVKVGTAKLTFYAPSNLVTSVDSQGDTVTNYIVTNTITYLGATTISNGVLALIAPDNFNGDPNASGGKSVSINLAGTSAVLDLSSMGYSTDGTNCITNSTLTLTSPQTLGGIGTIQGSVSVGVGVFLNPGNTMTGVDTNGVNVALTNGTSTGVLNVAGAMEIGGQVYMRLNTTNAVKGDEITANSFTIDGTATLLVTNIGPELTTAATFQLFNHLVNFPTGSVTLPTLTGTNSWVNNLAVDGSIVLVAPSLVNTNPTNITFSVSGSGTMLNLSWPADHTGWTLEVQTNTLATGLSNNWVRINNTASVNSTNFPIVATNGAVFYRLVYP